MEGRWSLGRGIYRDTCSVLGVIHGDCSSFWVHSIVLQLQPSRWLNRNASGSDSIITAVVHHYWSLTSSQLELRHEVHINFSHRLASPSLSRAYARRQGSRPRKAYSFSIKSPKEEEKDSWWCQMNDRLCQMSDNHNDWIEWKPSSPRQRSNLLAPFDDTYQVSSIPKEIAIYELNPS